MKKAIYYVNQFFGGVGGEAEADFEPIIKEGPVGPGLGLQGALKGAEITHTVICGDNFMASHQDEAIKRITGFLAGKEIDLFLAGPAFRAGRYGVSCGEMCKYANETYGVPAITSMHEENPGVDVYRENLFYILKGSAGAVKMRQDIAAMAAFANKIIAGEEILWADAEGYFPRGIRKEVFVDKTAADRTVDMLLAKIAGKPFETELKIDVRDQVIPSQPIADLSKAKIAVISSGGLVPMGNPDRMPGGTCSIWKTYDISKMDAIKPGEFYSVHCGINTDFVNADPGVLVPLSALREFEKEGVIGEVDNNFYSTTGNLATLKDARRMGKEMAAALKANHVDGAFLVST
jgi:glycine reductase